MTIYYDPIAEALDLKPMSIDFGDLKDYTEDEILCRGGFINISHTEESKKAISKSLKGRRTTEKICLKGDDRTTNQIKGKQVAAKKRKGQPTKGKNVLKGEQRTEAQKLASEKHSDRMKGIIGPNKGKAFSEEWKQKLSGPKPNARKPKPKIECPHCKKIGGVPQMKRHHFDNCKMR